MSNNNNNIAQNKGKKKMKICYCKLETDEEVRICDNLKCKRLWFHRSCLLKDEGKEILDEDEWLCKTCRNNL